MSRAWWVLDSYGCVLARTSTLHAALAWTVPADHRSLRHEGCSICTYDDLGGGVHEITTCEGIYTVTRHAPEAAEFGWSR